MVYASHFRFRISFLVDSRGGVFQGCRGKVHFAIPPGVATGPTRIVCRLLEKRVMPSLQNDETLVSPILSLEPACATFIG